ncbi:hypothetical protein EFR84_11445 [Rhizobium chutanense]|uniref:Uncharacterized protein n=2 Tax=Rhizobium chutanense TaxID=2035448 RepID=A0A3S0XX91_9HYPH|nr:hypothetical protein EFR84_11445 [Rhizobium chutanense]
MNINHAHTGPASSVATVSMFPVWEQDGVNKKWSQATPNGKLEMTITVPESVAQFELGKEYFLDFRPAD